MTATGRNVSIFKLLIGDVTKRHFLYLLYFSSFCASTCLAGFCCHSGNAGCSLHFIKKFKNFRPFEYSVNTFERGFQNFMQRRVKCVPRRSEINKDIKRWTQENATWRSVKLSQISSPPWHNKWMWLFATMCVIKRTAVLLLSISTWFLLIYAKFLDIALFLSRVAHVSERLLALTPQILNNSKAYSIKNEL